MRTSAMTQVIAPWEWEFDWHLDARLTSAIEAVPPVLRVQLQAREGVEQPSRALRALARDVFGRPETYTLYGASGTASDQPRHVPVRWQRERLLLADDDQVHGRLVTPSTDFGELTVPDAPTAGCGGRGGGR